MTDQNEEQFRVAQLLQTKADAMEARLRGQSSFYLQYEDNGHTATYIRALRDVALFLVGVNPDIGPGDP